MSFPAFFKTTMTLHKPHQLFATTALCLAAVGLSSCVQTSCLEPDDSEKPLPVIAGVKLPLAAQKALDKTLSGGLLPSGDADEDISAYLQRSSAETRYIMSILTDNKCNALGDGHCVLRLYILPNLCRDLDALLKQEIPSAETLDHAVWMASKLELHNLISFLVDLGAPANKYKLGE
jgi:hypothetical protein